MERTAMPVVTDDPVLRRFRAALEALYGDRLERVVLFGSRARGDHAPDSDYDVGVFLHGFIDRWQEVDRLIPVVADLAREMGAVISALPYGAGAYGRRTPLMAELRRDGQDL